MFKYLASEKLTIFWLIFHAFIGFASVNSMWPLVGWFYVLMATFIISLFRPENARFNLLVVICYTMTIEVLGRGVHANPYIPTEVGKYAGVVLFALGLVLGGPIKKISIYGVMLIFASLPGLLFSESLERKSIVFNYFGPLALFLGVIFCSRQILTFSQFKALLRITIYGIFPLACFAMFKAAEFDKIDYGVTANYEASAGSITNQVSTLMGAAIGIMALMYLSNQKMFRYQAIDLAVLGLFLVRGLLTFSRGGMISAGMAIVLLIIWPKAKSAWQDKQIRMRNVPIANLFISAILMAALVLAVNIYTNNYLLYRYQGRTEASLRSGFVRDKDRSLEQWSSGRLAIVESDLRMFLGNPFVGVGVGGSREKRHEYGGPKNHAAHVELSRMLAEHGLFGLLMVFMVFIYPFARLFGEPNNYVRSVRIVLLVMALSASFHNAMRTMITPVLFGFAFIRLIPDNYDWRSHLKQNKRLEKLRIETEKKRKLVSEAFGG